MKKPGNINHGNVGQGKYGNMPCGGMNQGSGNFKESMVGDAPGGAKGLKKGGSSSRAPGTEFNK